MIRILPARTILALMMLICSAVHEVNAQDYQLNTSEEYYWPAPQIEKPKYLETITDPTFGTKITRITGNIGTPVANTNESWRDVARHGYSSRQPWNADESIIYLDRHKSYSGGWGSALFLDGQTYEPIKKAIMPSGTNETRWHPTNPEIMLVLTNSSVVAFNVITNAKTTLIEFPGYTNTTYGEYTGNFTSDGRKVSILGRRTADSKYVGFVVDVVDKIKYPDIDFTGIDVDFITISPLGNYVVVNGNFGNGYDRTQIYDIQGNKVGSLWSEYGRPSHFDVAVDQNGDEVVVGGSKSAPDDGRVIKRRMSDGKVTVLTTGGYAGHASARSINRPGWVYSITSTSTSWKPYLGEIIAVKLDGSRTERICHTRHLWGVYDNQPQPVPSPSGTRVMFASDWNSGGLPIQAYVVDFRNLQSPDPPGNLNANAGEDVAVCRGNSTILTATGGTSYEWTTGETTASIEVSPDATTVYGVTVSDDDGSMGYDEVVVSVTELPNIDAGEDVTITAGESTELTATGGQTYVWSNGQAFNTITVSPSVTTTYTVTGTYGACENTDSVTVFVNANASSEPGTVTANAGNDVSICKGTSTTLTASGGSTYEWSTGATTASITVSPQTTTTYTVTAYNEAGDISDTDDVVVSVKDNPDVYAGEDVSITEGETITLVAIGAESYEWSTGATTSSIQVSPSTTTTYSVTGSTNSCESTDSIKVTVNAAEEASTGTNDPDNADWANAGPDKNICQGNSTTLTASEGDSYLWSNGENTRSITVAPQSTTTYSVKVFIDNQSSEDQATVFVSENPEVVIANGSEVSIVEGEFITLRASGADRYEWNNGATQPNVAVSPTQTTTYSVDGFINECYDTQSVTVNVVAKVEAGIMADQEICAGSSTTLTATGGDNYLWSTGETTATIEVSPEESTEYTVTVYNELDYDEASVFITVTDCSDVIAIGKGDTEGQVVGEFKVYKEFNNETLTIKIQGFENTQTVSMYDITGKLLFREDISSYSGSMYKRDIYTNTLSEAVYIIRFAYENETLIKKISIR